MHNIKKRKLNDAILLFLALIIITIITVKAASTAIGDGGDNSGDPGAPEYNPRPMMDEAQLMDESMGLSLLGGGGATEQPNAGADGAGGNAGEPVTTP